MPLSVTIPITTLTPIWTGDVNQKTEYLRATSFLGGLRFWTEGLCRSLGHKNICDITNSGTYGGINRDIYDSEDHPYVCLVCEVFGCTGKGRSFSLRVCDEKISNEPIGPIVLNERKYVVNGRTKIPRYLDGSPGKYGSFSLELTQMRPGTHFSELAAGLAIMLNWGTLGARDQYGYGLVKATLPNELVNLAMDAIPPHDSGDAGTPDRATLRDFFFFCSTAKDYPEIRKQPQPFLIRHDVRNDPALRSDNSLRHYWGGKLNKFGTNFNLGITADNAILGWGWFPRHGQFDSAQRDICLEALKREVINHSEPGTARWKEFGSSRDTCKSPGIWPDFLKDLISTTWR